MILYNRSINKKLTLSDISYTISPDVRFIFVSVAEIVPEETTLTDLYIPVKRASGEIAVPSSFLASKDRLLYFQSKVMFLKISFAKSTDDVANTIA